MIVSSHSIFQRDLHTFPPVILFRSELSLGVKTEQSVMQDPNFPTNAINVIPLWNLFTGINECHLDNFTASYDDGP